LTALEQLGFAPNAALRAMEDFQGLPHRQQALGEKNGILYVDDSISTTPQSAIAAMEVYRSRPITLIAGGYDRGIDDAPLSDYVLRHNIHALIGMGPSGERFLKALKERRTERVYTAVSMKEAVALAKQTTASGGVILLSPAAASYGLFKDFIERGKAFAAESGF
jgi:UDP-N-acetylmuramoylalanine--D-glutamate ligase